MIKYSGINYEQKEDCFTKTEHVKSSLLYGDLDYITKPWITVLIPTYKRAELLYEALQSVLAQWHTDYFWDILILDNEPYDGKPNAAEQLIRKLDNKRILYYRNSENMLPGDNFNRGFLLARGEWVCMLHDDDLVCYNTLQRLGKLIRLYNNAADKPLGAITASYVQIGYDPVKDGTKENVQALNDYLSSMPLLCPLIRHTHNHIFFTSHIGGNAPTNGSTYNRRAVIEYGGFNENFGIFADLILLYNMENQFSIYVTDSPLGFYRWGVNLSMKPETTYKFVKESFMFRKYAFKKNLLTRIWGRVFETSQFKKFCTDVIWDRNKASQNKMFMSDFSDICNKTPSNFVYSFYSQFIVRLYFKYKRTQANKLLRKLCRRVNINSI